MIVKCSISFIKKASGAQFGSIAKGVCLKLKDNTNFLTPPLSPPILQGEAAVDAFIAAYTASVKGSEVDTQKMYAARKVAGNILTQWSRQVDTISAGDLGILKSSGFPIQKPTRTPVGDLPAPDGLTLVLGNYSGDLKASAAKVAGGVSYNWRLSTAAAPTVVLQSAETTAVNTVFSGLTPGVVYQVTVNVVGSAGPSDWSLPTSQMAL